MKVHRRHPPHTLTHAPPPPPHTPHPPPPHTHKCSTLPLAWIASIHFIFFFNLNVKDNPSCALLEYHVIRIQFALVRLNFVTDLQLAMTKWTRTILAVILKTVFLLYFTKSVIVCKFCCSVIDLFFVFSNRRDSCIYVI